MAEPWNKGKRYGVADLVRGGHEIGEIVGPGVLSEYVGRNEYGHHLWLWRCSDCGDPHGPSTLSHMRRSVRCLTCSRTVDPPNWKGYRDLTGRYVGQIKTDAEKRGLLFEVTLEYLWEMWEQQNGRCIYTGLALTHGIDASLDRRDSAFGYVVGNLQWIHRDVNRMKSDFREDYFLRLCSLIADVVGFDTATPQLVGEFFAGRL